MKDTDLLVVALGALEGHEKLQVRGLTIRPHNAKPGHRNTVIWKNKCFMLEALYNNDHCIQMALTPQGCYSNLSQQRKKTNTTKHTQKHTSPAKYPLACRPASESSQYAQSCCSLVSDTYCWPSCYSNFHHCYRQNEPGLGL